MCRPVIAAVALTGVALAGLAVGHGSTSEPTTSTRKTPTSGTSWTAIEAGADRVAVETSQATLVTPRQQRAGSKNSEAATPRPNAAARPRVTQRTKSTRLARPVHPPVAPTSKHAAHGPTSWSALNQAIGRIPTYDAGDARWVVKDTGWWATADWYEGVIYVAPRVPESKLYDVVVHEWSHLLMVRDYDGDVDAATAAAKLAFGGKGLMGSEYAADCMAIEQGARWTNYTGCSSSIWREAARRLVAGKRLVL